MKYNKKTTCNIDIIDMLLTLLIIVISLYIMYFIYTSYHYTTESFTDKYDTNFVNINDDIRYNFTDFNENKPVPDLVLTNKTGGFMIRVDYTTKDNKKEVVWIENNKSYNFHDIHIDSNKIIHNVDISVYKAQYIHTTFSFKAYESYKINIDSKDYQSLLASVNDL